MRDRQQCRVGVSADRFGTTSGRGGAIRPRFASRAGRGALDVKPVAAA